MTIRRIILLNRKKKIVIENSTLQIKIRIKYKEKKINTIKHILKTDPIWHWSERMNFLNNKNPKNRKQKLNNPKKLKAVYEIH